MAQNTTNIGMRIFNLIWLGELVSILGSDLTGFALDVWVYQRTGSVTQFAIIALCGELPEIVISPLAGALVDRWNHRWTMIISDTGEALSTLALVLILATGHFEIWHLCIVTAISSTFSVFHSLAYTAAIPLLVPKQHLSRVGGMLELGETGSDLISPLLGGFLLVTIQLHGVILLDFATYFFALVPLLLVRFPNVKATAAGKAGKGSLLQEIAYGWSYITTRPGLLGLLIFFAAGNFFMGIIGVLIIPLVLSFASPTVLGIILSIDGAGALMGAVVVSTWGGPSRLIYSILGFQLLGGLSILVTGLRTSVPLLAVASFLFAFGSPFIDASSQALWQTKVAPDVQGRVFAVRRTIAGLCIPLAYLVAGPLSDRVFEPLMAANGPLASSIGQLIGVGPGRGIGLLFIVVGAILMLLSVVAYQYPRLRLVEDELPDIDEIC